MEKSIGKMSPRNEDRILDGKHTSNGGNCCTNSVLTYDQQMVSIGHLCDRFYRKSWIEV
jgi:hypothetical protein